MAVAASSTAPRNSRDGARAKRPAPPPRPYGVDPGSNRLASPAIRAVIGRRLAEISGLAMAMAGIFVFVTLITYNPRDPSLNTATSQHATNLGGPIGSVFADFLLQGFGCAGGLPGLAMLIWAWKKRRFRSADA
jgi:S-DNA-T family DNA segregation ATPase FtsK/SpoIIIE